jgi:hypothetical protein
MIDGEVVVLNVDGTSDFRALHSRKHDHDAQFCAFDILVAGGDDYRRLPLTLRKQNLARLLARGADGIHAASYEQGEIGPDLFRHACLLGFPNTVRAAMAPAAAPTGSRSRTGSIRRIAACWISFEPPGAAMLADRGT